MFSPREFPTPTSIFSAFASLSASMMVVRTVVNDLLPEPLRRYIISAVRSIFRRRPSSTFTLTIEEFNGISKNEVFEASEVYLSTKLSPDTQGFKISKGPKDKSLVIQLENGEKIIDHFEGIELTWNFCSVEPERKDRDEGPPRRPAPEKRSFKLRFDKCYKDTVLNSYIPSILEKAKRMKDEKRALRIFTLSSGMSYRGSDWDSIGLEHPATFDTIAMNLDQKQAIIDDLNRFIKNRDFYRRVGRAWKRGYLLYGPPGTGKSSLVAAMANYLKFDIYDLQLNNIYSDAELRRLLLTTTNQSILVIEDIDCSVDLPRNMTPAGQKIKKPELQEIQDICDLPGRRRVTLSGLLNFIDGLWSSSGDERIIVFTTNHVEKLDPALLRPGRMDMHIHMGYCTFEAFKCLASNYLGLSHDSHHCLFEEVKSTIDEAKVTPAQVAEEMMKNYDADVALNGVVKLLRKKKLEGERVQNDSDGAEIEIQESKKLV